MLQISGRRRDFAMMVAAIVPTTTGHRARDPRAIRTPADTPAAGQKTATPSGLVSRARTKPRCHEICDANRDSEPNRANPPRRVDAGGQLMLNLFSVILSHPALSRMKLFRTGLANLLLPLLALLFRRDAARLGPEVRGSCQWWARDIDLPQMKADRP